MNTKDSLESLKQYVRAANYLTAIQIYLKDNFLLTRPLISDDIKPRLLGHWGTCPGINFIYANMNLLINKYQQESLFILGPGHGFAALQANLFLEGTFGHYYPEATRTVSGIGYIARNFCWPYRFPSHSNPGAPGVILEGGELGYALATAYGAALDNPNLMVLAVIGDGEAETGPTATAWHLHRLIDPKTNGAVLPILHLNGYKISGPTIFGRMPNEELISLFTGYGYTPFIVEGEDIYQQMIDVMEKAYQFIQEGRTSDNAAPCPMIILKTPKGWTGIKELKGERVEDNYISHQVVAKNAKTDDVERAALEVWFRSYHFEELFDEKKGFSGTVISCIPDPDLCMGESKHASGGPDVCKSLILPDIRALEEDSSVPGTIGSSSMRRAGLYLHRVFELNKQQKNFRLFSPDETYSNKLDEVFQSTSRAFVLPVKPWDKDLSPDGRVMEILSEHNLQGLMQGYVLTGRHAVFTSYEAFIQIIASMADQYAKFLKIAREISWRKPVPSFTYILTSSGWRQEHNGFSHQNPGFISDMLEHGENFVHVYFPPDGNTTLLTLEHAMQSRNEINIIVAGKTLEPRWLTMDLAKKEFEKGLMTWDFASDHNPDIVISAIGDYLTFEALAAISIVKKETPHIAIRFVNIMSLSSSGFSSDGGQMSLSDFESFFTVDKPVLFNFHGYTGTLKQLLFNTGSDTRRFFVHGFSENGSTTTPFDMHVRNGTSRYQIALEIWKIMQSSGRLDNQEFLRIYTNYQNKLRAHRRFIIKNGVDPEEITTWQWKRTS